MRLPEFLIIGAMKAGTTTLYRDLMTNPRIFFPLEKEKSNLLRDEVLTPSGRREYAGLFRRAGPDQLCGVAPTNYTMLPDRPGVPQRALRVHGPGLKAIYLVREPVARCLSQYQHELAAGSVAAGVDEAIRREPRFVNYSRYAMQVAPWLDTFGPDHVLILHFEAYVADRRETVARVCRFLGVEPRLDLVQDDVAYNRGDGKPVPRGLGGLLRRTAVYRALVRPYLPPGVRETLRGALLPKAPPPGAPSPATVRHIIDELGDDPDRLRRIMGRPEPLWDLREVLHRFQSAGAAESAAQRSG